VDQNLGVFDLFGAWKGAFDGAHHGYAYMLATVFFITDAGYRMVAAVINNFIGAMTVILVYRITRTLFSDWAAERAAWWCCFMPSLVIWSAQTVKEPTVIFLETLAMYACLHLKSKSFRIRHFWLLCFSLVFLVTFRFYAAYLAIVAILVSLALPNLKKFNFSTVTAGFVGVLVIALLYGSGALIQNEAMVEKFNLKQVKEFRVNVAEGSGSGVKMDVDIETPLGFIYGVGMGGAYLLLAPFPWQWGGGSTRLLLTLPELLVWWFLFFKCVLPGMKKSIQERFTDVLPVLIFFLRVVHVVQCDVRKCWIGISPTGTVITVAAHLCSGGNGNAQAAAIYPQDGADQRWSGLASFHDIMQRYVQCKP